MKIHQSNLVNYFTCPQKYALSYEHKIPQSDAMRDGLLFEGYLFGFKGGEETQKKLEGRKKPDTLQWLKDKADFVRPLFLTDLTAGAVLAGEAYVKLSYKDLEGEADFIGMFDGELQIVDVKFTSDIETIWNQKTRKHEFLQSVFYPYMVYKNTKKILPFTYLLVENSDSGLIKKIRIEVTKEDFRELETILEMVQDDCFLEPNYNACFSFYGKVRCDYANHCPYFRKKIQETKKIKYSDLL